MQNFRSHRQQKYSKQMATYGILLVVAIIFFGTVGVKLLVNGTVFITRVMNPERPEKGVEGLMTPPELTLLTATNSASLKITGKADPKKDLSIFVNGDAQKELFLTEENFEEEVSLDFGENTIYAVITDPKTKKTEKSETYTVRYSNSKPKLEIITPTTPTKVFKNEIQIEGQTDPELTVYIQGSPVVVDSEGKFSRLLSLNEGENKIIVEAQDSAGNSETKELVVTYEKD